MALNIKHLKLILLVIFGFLLCLFLVLRSSEQSSSYFFPSFTKVHHYSNKPKTVLDIEYNELEFGDNITGFPHLIVPNIVHNILFNIKELKFSHFISILSVLKNQRPDIYYIHCDCTQLTGQYYHRILEKAKTTNTQFIVRYIEKPTQIYGKELSKEFLNWHASDITRLRVLIQFGGIYLDNDVYVVQSLDFFRKFEMVINWEQGQLLGNQVMIAHKNARFLNRYLDSYHAYNPSMWYFNAGELPTISILHKNPEIVHRVEGKFGVDAPKVCPKIYSFYYKNWRKEFYTIHLVMRGNDITFPKWCFGNNVPKVISFNEKNVLQLGITFGEMCWDVLK